MKLEFSRQIFEKYSNINFHENPSGGSRVVPCGRTDGTRISEQSLFANFVKAPKNETYSGNVTARAASTINLINPTGHVTHQQFNIQQLYVLPTLYLCHWNKTTN